MKLEAKEDHYIGKRRILTGGKIYECRILSDSDLSFRSRCFDTHTPIHSKAYYTLVDDEGDKITIDSYRFISIEEMKQKTRDKILTELLTETNE